LINLFAYFYVLFNALVIYCNILFQLYVGMQHFVSIIGTYVRKAPPQCKNEVMEEAKEKPMVVHRPHMPHMKDMRVRLEVVDQLCHFMTSHRVVPIHVRDILHV
jgi:hypothetical protein